MKLATLRHHGREAPVLIAHGAAWDLQSALGALSGGASAGIDPARIVRITMVDLIAAGEGALAACRLVEAEPERFAAARLDLAGLEFLAPIPRTPRNVFCLGRNYADHIREDNASRDKDTGIPEHPQFFTKPPSAIVGPGAEIRYDERVTRRLDYEVELAVVIGTGGRDIAAGDAMRHVFGYTIVNDITARDLQKRHDQWFKGKGLDTSCPMGPVIVTADEVPDPHALRISLDVNGQRRQDASTAQMIFRIPETIESLSAGLTLEPGDVIATGTPSGVGFAMNPRQWLKGGDTVVCRIEGIGELTNEVVAV